MKNLLKEILSNKKKEVEALKSRTPITHFVDSKQLLGGVRPFKEAISGGNNVNLIAEIKKRSPSNKKDFLKHYDYEGVAQVYEDVGAKAISALTDKRYFGGDISHINNIKKKANLPVLRKDFIVDEYQVYESRYFGADCILLIARILTKEEMGSFMHLAERVGMDVLVEVHDEWDLEKALLNEAKIIGINNRDLDTLNIDLDTTFRLISKIPKGIVKVSESGIKTNNDIKALKKAGINAVLIGGSLLSAEDIGGKAIEIMGENGI
ncbi:MAG: indole-3-glycerol phosphate synthase TrpC [Candidatus Omnitrophota bacterium]